ncbi:hypothetical protein ISF_06718 [Cordyceps fumosorosea ARSEF 2679]|uniref:NAD(P)-binding domain protein n=1 Tax=Cordyceps fumosorosea (strain ARSEF 2679) TaxID=1081104 RepID=A0A167R1D4_CORFA|nr:hypothetical protein ISF_06718 [Cordyceps fumosorosea ARSEF 2679]OAA58179.1 hypothetical protein ISF_06718 [Cordyceps fumosorosea ARSEF 2679]
MPEELKDKNFKPIEVGDHVLTPIRGGCREGDVSQLIHNEEEAEAAGLKNPPKHKHGRAREIAKALQSTGCDTICLVPPAHQDKYDICVELVEVAKKAQIPNVCLISSVGCDYATAKKQPRLREFIDLETLVLQSKGDASTPTGGSPCVIRKQAKEESTLPLPIGNSHKFAPVALGMMVVIGLMLCAGEELATAASKALGVDLKAEAKRVLAAQSDIDESEQQYLLEYYSLVREGKTNYIATTAFHDVTGEHPTEPSEFFSMYKNEMRPKKVVKRNHK